MPHRGRRCGLRSPRPFWRAFELSQPPSTPTVTHPHLTLLAGSTDRSVRARKTSLGAAAGPALLSSGVIHTIATVNKSTELMGADTGREAGGKSRLSI